MSTRIIRHKQHRYLIQQFHFFFASVHTQPLVWRSQRPRHAGCYSLGRQLMEMCMMAVLTSRLFWDKKIKIAILALATFIALC